MEHGAVESNLVDESTFVVSDPSTWPNPLTANQRHLLVTTEVNYDELLKKNTKSELFRFFQHFRFGFKHNGEPRARNWLRISESSASVFCVACCLFSNAGTPWSKFGVGMSGFQGFHTPLKGLRTHEESKSHIEAMLMWHSQQNAIRKGMDIDTFHAETQRQNITKWKLILRGVLDAIVFLSENNLAFRGASSDIQNDNCGNFLNLIKLLAKYYAPLGAHLDSITSNPKKPQVTYLSWEIQNEFIQICGDAVKTKILEQIKNHKYFAVMVDSTPDVSKKDQLSFIIRHVSASHSGCFVLESFLDFVSTTKKTGKDIAEVILKTLEDYGLSIENCVGQGYDNGSNMSGVHNGVQAKISEKNINARYVPCLAHSLNLVGTNAAENVKAAKLILGEIQNLYNFFASSTSRWSILLSHCKITLKCQSATRWSAKAQAVSALSTQFNGVISALEEIIRSDTFSADVTAAASNQLRIIRNFKFMLALKIWDEILSKINFVNKDLQSNRADLTHGLHSLNALREWLQNYKITGFMNAVKEASKLAIMLSVDLSSGFENVRRGRGINRKYLDGADIVELRNQTNEVRFKQEFFDELVAKVSSEMDRRFKEVKQLVEDFGFLWGDELLKPDAALRIKRAEALCSRYSSDLDFKAMSIEMELLPTYLAQYRNSQDSLTLNKPLDVLSMLHQNNLSAGFTNTDTALRIFLTLPISVASNERAFSKLKIIKNYLRSSMSQERLNSLARLSIERSLVKDFDFDDIIAQFATNKNRRVVI